MFEKIKNLKWHFQLLLLLFVAGLLYGTVYYFVTGPTREEIAVLTDQVSQLQAKNEAARLATQRINEFRALYASKAAEYEELKVLLPEQREITNVLQGLQDNAKDARLVVMRFTPRDDTSQNAISAKPVEVEVDANFNNLRAFYEKMAQLPRIVSITDFKINQLDKQKADKTLHAQFLLTAYYADPDALNKPAQPAKPGTPGAPAGAPGQPAPAAPAAQPPAAK
ncbi:MAG: type 4a pilus biogenesis protein PilO [Pyrinomonadaceae bacterium]|jgi:type IV pilus assembly protein PilO|nr:type 4a pilus biogenesis protein PilO [Blastocatellia bacterium]MCW5955210.1 type 4a pilus biogenesis protein PilO [Pyrinomonadaceae bacterium]